MSGTRDVAGRRYAVAVLGIAKSSGELDTWQEAIENLDALTGSPSHVEILQGDGMTDDTFQNIVRRVMPDISSNQINLFRLLRRKNRLSLGPSIQSFFKELLDDEQNVARATVTSAVPLDESQAVEIADKLSTAMGKKIIVETKLDSSIIGGLVIRVGDRLIDASTRGQLGSLRTHIARS
jgi:F-type H+-transporting ATPase subunit delta|tara:strand:- start:6078 stop:6617 length:540 start_codon:yes stop_codon:yes gene_type:complete